MVRTCLATDTDCCSVHPPLGCLGVPRPDVMPPWSNRVCEPVVCRGYTGRHVQTDAHVGLTSGHVDEAVQILCHHQNTLSPS
eukprot:1700678-Rhodomonas_salina.1